MDYIHTDELKLCLDSQSHNQIVGCNPTIGCTSNSWMQLHSNAYGGYQGALKRGPLL